MELKGKTSSELIQMLANATVTRYGCGGHWKAERNQHNIKEIETRLNEIGHTIPDKDSLFIMGKFNGDGSC